MGTARKQEERPNQKCRLALGCSTNKLRADGCHAGNGGPVTPSALTATPEAEEVGTPVRPESCPPQGRSARGPGLGVPALCLTCGRCPWGAGTSRGQGDAGGGQADAGVGTGLTGREGVDVEGHVLLLAVHHIQQVGADGPLSRICTEVQDHHPQHREDDANGLPVGDIAKGQAWWSTRGRQASAPTRSRSRPRQDGCALGAGRAPRGPAPGVRGAAASSRSFTLCNPTGERSSPQNGHRGWGR